MKILVVYSLPDRVERKTVFDHLYSFKRYVKEAEFHYCNALTGLPFWLKWADYDGVIFHYTFLAMRWWQPFVWRRLMRGCRVLKGMRAFKVAIPQDEYAHTNDLCRFFKRYSVDALFTCALPVDYETLYPKEKTTLKKIITTFPGFVDEETEEKIRLLAKKSHSHRTIDISYRARDLPFWLGKFGQLKGDVARAFKKIEGESALKMDISVDPGDVFYGDEWLEFLLKSRAVIGCLGGASLHDPDGLIRERVEGYTHLRGDATFEEVEAACFPHLDNTLSLATLSPRHFECAMTRTCQLLVEGDYQGVLQAGVHYIEIKKDFSNLGEVLDAVKNCRECEQMAERTYQDLIASGAYTYRQFANQVALLIKPHARVSKRRALFHWVGLLLRLQKRLILLQRFHFRLLNFLVRLYYFFYRRYCRYCLKEEREPTSRSFAMK